MASRTQPRVVPVLNGDEARYRRRYRTLKDMVNDLSDESNLLALRVHQIQRRMYDRHTAETGRPPAPVPVPENATWAPLVQNATHYPADVGMPPAKAPIASVAPSSPALDDDERRNGSVSDLSSEASDGDEAGSVAARPAARAEAGSRKREREEADRPSFRERRDRERERERERERARAQNQRRRTMSADEGDDGDDDDMEPPARGGRNGGRAEVDDELESLAGDDDGSDGESARNVDAEIEDMMDDY